MLKTIFSYSGQFNRIEYLKYGFILPILLFAALFILDKNSLNSNFLLFGALLILTITLSSTIKRARDCSSSTAGIITFVFFLYPVGLMFLLFEPNGRKESTIMIILLAIMALTVVIGAISTLGYVLMKKDSNTTRTISLSHG